MKNIQDAAGVISRVSDDYARALVAKGSHVYAPKKYGKPTFVGKPTPSIIHAKNKGVVGKKRVR